MLLPVVVLAAGILLWDLVVRINGIPPYVLPGPWLVATTLVQDWPILWHSLLTTLATTLEGFVAQPSAASRWRCCSTNRVAGIFAAALCGHPAGDAGHRDRAAAADLPAAAGRGDGLCLDRRVLSGAVEHHARAQFGRPQSRGLFQLYGASRLQTLRYLKLPAALPYILGGLRIAGGLSLIGAVVAEIAAGSAGAGSGLAYRIAESGYRLNIPRMFAALLLLSLAGIVIYTLLSLALASDVAALARKRAWKGKLMAAAISSEKIDLLVYGPHKPIVDNGFSDQFVLHKFETTRDLERLTPAVAEKIRGMAITDNSVPADSAMLARFPKLEIVSSFGVGYDHVDAAMRANTISSSPIRPMS